MRVGLALLLLFVCDGIEGSHIVNGRESVPHSHPYMASLQLRGRLVCGGTLIREDFVLTAAHCKIPVPYTVVLGSDSLSGDEPTKQEFRSIQFFPHPDYDGHMNDIMLIKLSGRATLNNAVQLIPLKPARLPTSSKCLTAGWGDVGITTPYQPGSRRSTSPSCHSKAAAGDGDFVPIVRTMVCGVGETDFQGICSGDSGGPLVCNGAVAGVVSFSGRRCGDRRTPDVYMRVSSFSDWIMSVLNKN